MNNRLGDEARPRDKGITPADIKASLKAQIERGELPEGSRVSSEHQLARQHGFTRNQARQALRALEMEGYLIRRQGSGSYVAPLDGRITAIRAAVNGTVALVFPQYLSRYSREVVDGFMQHMAQAGRQTIAYNLQRDPIAEVRMLHTLSESGIAGLVAWVERDSRDTRRLIAQLCSRSFPLVLIDRCLEGLDVDCVMSDNEAIGYRLTRVLLEQGHQRIGFAGLEQNPASSIRDRLRGYRRALEEADIAYDERIVGADGHALQQSSDEIARQFMALADRPTAFVCIHDLVMKLLYDSVIRLGYMVPGQVAFAAVEDEHPPERPEIPLVSIRQQAQAIGEKSAVMLIERIGHPEMRGRRVLIEPLAADIGTEETVEHARAVS